MNSSQLLRILGRENSKPPALKAKARAGADVSLNWTPIARMHQGPIVTYLGYLPTPDTPPQQVKFFKIFEKGFDPSIGAMAEYRLRPHADDIR
jgi:hypothetical protein